MTFDLSIFKAYDIRGTYPDQLNEDLFYKLGQAYAAIFKPEGEVVVGNDVRIHSEDLKKQLIAGLVDAGVDVVDIGLASTDMLYFAVGQFGFAGGIQSTASHNPPEYHGAKMVRAQVVPISLETGIAEVKQFVIDGKEIKAEKKGSVRQFSVLEEYAKWMLEFIDTSKVKPMKVVINPNFGYAGKVFEKIVEVGNLPIEIVPLNNEPDGNFPKGRPDPFIPENRTELMNLVKETNADLGIAWDADADRVFFCADGGLFVDPYYLNTILIRSMLKKYPKEKVVYDPRYTWALLDAINESGGIAILERVGHSYIKERMREENALFAGESSGHTYYRDFWYADCGMIPPMQVMEYLGENSQKLSEIVSQVMHKYYISQEINSTVKDVNAIYEKLKTTYKDGKQDTLDGLTIEFDEYRFNVRPSNTEPLLRLNLEATSKELMEQKRDEVLAVIRS